MIQQFTLHNTWYRESDTIGPRRQGVMVNDAFAFSGTAHAGIRPANARVAGRPFVGQIEFAVTLVSAASTVKQTLRTGRGVARPRISWAQSANRRIGEMRTWQPNWDRQNALAFSTSTIRSARQVLRQLRRFYPEVGPVGAPGLVPMPDGSIRFELRTGQKELFLTVLENTVEAQKWHPLENVESIDYAELPVNGIRTELEWLRA